MLSKSAVAGLAEAAKADAAGLKSSHLIRQFISEGLARRKRQAASAPAAKKGIVAPF
jgi:hypothetical protein